MRATWIGILLSVLASLVQPDAGSARAAQLAITKAVNNNPMIIGAESVYTITVSNTGDQPADGITMTDTLPAGLTAGALPSGCSAAGQTITCGGAGLTLGPGEEQTWQIPVTVDPSLSDGTNIVNSAQVSSTTPGVPSQSTQLISQTQTQTDVEITKTAVAGPAPPGAQQTKKQTHNNQPPHHPDDPTHNAPNQPHPGQA
ncbi:DUF11 domain-containing protein, partial [Nonomuraea sp. NPDC050663]|uniref:DUF11 domain-containing protein n=1 Tax=Nonomuraea sp. NPDC050663 TaxID=3364370 RepID=UPI0037B68330